MDSLQIFTLTAEQQSQIDQLTRSLRPGQALWLSGYFAGLQRSEGAAFLEPLSKAASPIPPVAPSQAPAGHRSLTILFGGETGNSAGLAEMLSRAAREHGIAPKVVDMANYKQRGLKEEQDILLVTSTHGEGDPPQSAKPFFEFLSSRKAPKLPDVRFAVLALGDSTYEKYCEAGRTLDQRFEELGATRIATRVECDVDYEEAAAAWIAAAVGTLSPKDEPAAYAATPSPRVDPAPAPAAFDKKHPFSAEVIENLVLTGRGSSKETRHVELSLAGSGLAFEPGDALGVLPRNDPHLVTAILDSLSLSSDATVAFKDRTTTLGEALATDFEIVAATPRLIDQWAGLSGSAELAALKGEAAVEARSAFLRSHHVIDIVRRFPVKGLDPKALLAGLRPLQPRLYSIASSLAAAPDEAHLTVSTVRYDLNGSARAGVASGHLAERAGIDAALPVYVQHNPHFRLPEDDQPILMIGAGTGVAPYRAFIQEREARGARGKSWLFFGDRNFSSDFLYQSEWQGFLKDGTLSRMNVAFSRDRLPKTYVQHRLREHARDIYAWLMDGAHVYLCGDAAGLAPDVHTALGDIVDQEGGLGPEAAAEYLDSLRRDHRYQIDVY